MEITASGATKGRLDLLAPLAFQVRMGEMHLAGLIADCARWEPGGEPKSSEMLGCDPKCVHGKSKRGWVDWAYRDSLAGAA